jgi:5-deoxy-glucuronate isomerase
MTQTAPTPHKPDPDRASHEGLRRTSLVKAGEVTEHISLELVEASEGAVLEFPPGSERLAVILSGRARADIAGRAAGTAGGRDDVFDAAGDALYLPETAGGSLVAEGGVLSVALASCRAGSLPPGPARLIRARDQRIATVGSDTWRRTVRTILGPDDAASRLLVGETINGPGLWSSYPPHRHDRESDDEVRLEEVYLFRLHPANGFGVQVRYVSDAEQETRMVRDGDVAVITTGYHPVVAAPGYELYYLWVMAGEGRVMRPHFDPRYTWVEGQGR